MRVDVFSVTIIIYMSACDVSPSFCLWNMFTDSSGRKFARQHIAFHCSHSSTQSHFCAILLFWLMRGSGSVHSNNHSTSDSSHVKRSLFPAEWRSELITVNTSLWNWCKYLYTCASTLLAIHVRYDSCLAMFEWPRRGYSQSCGCNSTQAVVRTSRWVLHRRKDLFMNETSSSVSSAYVEHNSSKRKIGEPFMQGYHSGAMNVSTHSWIQNDRFNEMGLATKVQREIPMRRIRV